MQGRKLGRVALLVLAFSAPVLGAAQAYAAQQARAYSIPEPEFIGQSEPAPEWMVWRAFHRSLQFYAVQSSQVVNKLLTSRLGIGEDAAMRFLNLGKQYGDAQLRLDADISKEAARRLGTHTMPPEVRAAAEAARTRITQRRSPTSQERVREQSRGPRVSIEEALEQSGAAAVFDTDRTQALQSHQQDMLGLLGRAGYIRLLGWIDAEVKDKVRVSHAGVSVPMP